MHSTSWLLGIIGVVVSSALVQESKKLEPDPPMVCSSCVEWNQEREPFRVYGNTYFVGTAGLSAVLVTSDEGHVLLDGALSQSVPLIDENIRALGFRTEDIRLILSSHEHYDHAGGIAALQRFTGAPVVATPTAAPALEKGGPLPTDPQIGFGVEENAFPAVANVRAAADGEKLRVGALEITAHHTPGHTPGGMTWSWQSCQDGRCLNVVYADSLTAVSAPGYRYTDTPDYVTAFRRTLEKVRGLPCDVLLSTHPVSSGLDGKIERRAKGEQPDPFIDAGACEAYADSALRTLEKRLTEER